jgi:hypothetical protein
LPTETMRHLPFSGPVRPTGLERPRRLAILVGETGGRPIGPTHPAEADRSLPEKGSPGRCFPRATPLTPGHNIRMSPKLGWARKEEVGRKRKWGAVEDH